MELFKEILTGFIKIIIIKRKINRHKREYNFFFLLESTTVTFKM